MKEWITYTEARDLLLAAVEPVNAERVHLEACAGRILAEEIKAIRDVPAFDRAAFDGYALRAEDLAGADAEHPVTLPLTGTLRAGDAAERALVPGTAMEIMTGAPVPPGADAVVMLERTRTEAGTVSFYAPVRPGENVIPAGEDLRIGQAVLAAGTELDPGALGLLAAQGIFTPLVHRLPRVGIVSTGRELTADDTPGPGRIYDVNRYLLTAALRRLGCETVFLGTAPDDAQEIAELLCRGIPACDTVVVTGGVSAGRWDLTPAALELAGAQLLFRGVDLKPGKACAYGMAGKVPVIALSGNPSAAWTNLHAVAAPALRRQAGRRDCLPRELILELLEPFPKESRRTRLLRGHLELCGGKTGFRLPTGQSNSMLSSLAGSDAIAVVPAGSGPLPAGTCLKGFLI